MDAPVRHEQEPPVSLPWHLQVVAFLWFFYAFASGLNLIVGFFFDWLYFDWGAVVAFLIGWGLLTLKDALRKTAVVLGVLGAAGGTLGIGVLLWRGESSGNFRVYGQYIGPMPLALAIALTVSLLLGALFQIWVLRRKGVRALFQGEREGKARWGLLMGTALAAACLLHAASLYALHRWEPGDSHLGWYEDQSDVCRSVSWGERYGRLAYIVFHAVEGRSISPRVHPSSRIGSELKMPDGERISLPGPHFIYEYRFGNWRTSDLRVTAEEFGAFMDSHPGEYSVDSLTRFVRKRRR